MDDRMGYMVDLEGRVDRASMVRRPWIHIRRVGDGRWP